MLNLDLKHRARDVQARNFPYKHLSLISIGNHMISSAIWNK